MSLIMCKHFVEWIVVYILKMYHLEEKVTNVYG